MDPRSSNQQYRGYRRWVPASNQVNPRNNGRGYIVASTAFMDLRPPPLPPLMSRPQTRDPQTITGMMPSNGIMARAGMHRMAVSNHHRGTHNGHTNTLPRIANLKRDCDQNLNNNSNDGSRPDSKRVKIESGATPSTGDVPVFNKTVELTLFLPLTSRLVCSPLMSQPATAKSQGGAPSSNVCIPSLTNSFKFKM